MQSKIKSILNRLNRRDIPLFPKFRINKYFKLVLILFAVFSTVFVTKTILAQDATSETDSTETTPETTQTETVEIEPVPQESIQIFQQKQKAMEEGNNQESWMKESIGSNAMVGINVLAGTIPSGVFEGKATSWVPGGILGFTTKSIAALYNIPISGTEYLAYIKNNFLGKTTYAATGYESLSPLIPIWKGFRNVTYVLFSVIFVAIGIMIMLRVKISPQAVITLQSAIPKLITSLILVTFSYAIVGLLIDLSYIIEGLGVSIILKATNDSGNAVQILNNPNVMGRAFGIAPILSVIGALTGIAGAIVIFLGPAAWLLGGIALILLTFVVIGMIVVNVVKFFIGIIKCWISIILKTIIGPLEIALGAIPNMKMGFGTWFTDILANVLVFPICLIYLVGVRKLMDILTKDVTMSNSLWTPTGLEWLKGGNIAATVIGLAALFLLPKLPKLIPEFIFQIKPSPYGKALGESFSGVVALGKGGGRMALNNMGGKWANSSKAPTDKDGNPMPDDRSKATKFKYVAGKLLEDATSKH